MTAELWCSLGGALLSAAALVIVAIINNRAKHNEEQARNRAARRERESRLSMNMMAANSELSDVIAIAVSGGHTNGNVEAAREKARKAREEYECFLMDEAAHNVAKI